MEKNLNSKQYFEIENLFYLNAPTSRISKFVTHLDIFRRISQLPGEIIECGVFRGSSFMRWVKFRDLLENTNSRRIIGFDTFGAFPETSLEFEKERRDFFVEETDGGVSISKRELLTCLEEGGFNNNLELIEGDIKKTLPEYIKAHSYLKIALLHIDVDLYEPTKIILETLFPHIVRGGIIILDDYGAMPGANKAIDGYFVSNSCLIQKIPFSNAISYIVKE